VEPRPSTPSERRLWRALEGRAPGWVREYDSGPYRLDFYCPHLRLAVEVDGGSHYGKERAAYDGRRDLWHMRRDIATMRVSAEHVMRDLPGVVQLIDERVNQRSKALGIPPEKPVEEDLRRRLLRLLPQAHPPRKPVRRRRPATRTRSGYRRRPPSLSQLLVRLALVAGGMWLLLHVAALHTVPTAGR
jgi:very-short-patch-repair endonuclease